MQLNLTTSPVGPTAVLKQTGYVYVGGFGGNENAALDAGFQYSAQRSIYTLFSRDYETDGPNQMDADGNGFACGQTVSYDLYTYDDPVFGNNTIIVGSGNNTTGSYTSEAIMDQSNDTGFPQNGAGVRLKRMTTIAQQANNFSNGTTFAINSVTGSPEVVWSQCQIGVFDPYDKINYLTVWTNGNGSTQNYPNDSSVVVTSYTDMAGETDGLNLHF